MGSGLAGYRQTAEAVISAVCQLWRAGGCLRIMLKRQITLPPVHLYPADEWRIVEARYSDEFVGLTETVFSLGNGFLGVRGSFEEGRPALVPGTFVNGFHETWPIVHAEGAPALAKTGQTIVNVPTRRSSSCTWTTRRSSCRPRGCRITGGSWTCGPGR